MARLKTLRATRYVTIFDCTLELTFKLTPKAKDKGRVIGWSIELEEWKWI